VTVNHSPVTTRGERRETEGLTLTTLVEHTR